MTHNALVTRLGLEIGISSQEVSDFRLDGLREQGPCPVAQNLSERIAEGPWLSQLDDVSVGHGVSLLWWRSGGVEHPHDTPPYPFLPSPTSAHSSVDLLIIQIDGLHIGNDLVLVTALGIDGNGDRHPLGLVERATENTAVVQALIDNLIERGLDPTVCRLFIIDGAKALSKVIRRTFGGHTAIHRCQLHQASNVIERLPKAPACVGPLALRKARGLDDAKKAERLLRNLARRLDQVAPGVAAASSKVSTRCSIR